MTNELSDSQNEGGYLAEDLLHGAQEIARFLGVPRRSVYYYAGRGELPIFRIGNQLKARKSSLCRYIAKLENSPSEEGAFR